MRLAKYLARAGVASRRQAEELIRAGRVRLNGVLVSEVVTLVDPSKDRIELDDRLVGPQQLLYVLLNKPAGYVSTVRDSHGRPTVVDLTADLPVRLHPVGRLDCDTEGLLLMTNDGEFTNLVTHPRYKVDKTYLVNVQGYVTDEETDHLRQGVELEDGLSAPAVVRIKERNTTASTLEMIIHEGRKRQVKRMCAAIGHPVEKLRRIRLGGLDLGGLEAGQYRLLSQEEVGRIRDEALG